MEPVAPVLPSSSGLVQRAHDASDMCSAGYQKCAKFAEQPNQLLEKHEACMCATQQWVSSAGPQVGPTQATCSYSTIGFELHGLKISCQSLFTCTSKCLVNLFGVIPDFTWHLLKFSKCQQFGQEYWLYTRADQL